MAGFLHNQCYCDIFDCNCEGPGGECKRWGRRSEVAIQQAWFAYKQRNELITLKQITFKHVKSHCEQTLSYLPRTAFVMRKNILTLD